MPYVRKLFCILALIVMLPGLQACSDTTHPVMKSPDAVRKYLKFNTPVRGATAQILTLPESGGLTPGPTDYVALVASVQLSSDDLQATLGKLFTYEGNRTIPTAFTHPAWLAVRDRAILSAVSSGSTRVYDASPLAIDKSVRALAMPVDNSLLIYVEYAAPFGNKP